MRKKRKRKRLEDFEEQFHPFHFYNYIRELEVPNERAREISKFYEQEIYKPLVEDIRKKYKPNI